MKNSVCNYSVLLLPVFVFALGAQAAVIPTSIEIDHHLQFTKPDFSDATWSSTLTITVSPDSSGTKNFDLLFWPENFGLSFFSTGGVTIDQTSAPPQTSSRTIQVTASGAGTFGVNETAGPETDFNSGDPLTVYTSSNLQLPILDFGAPSGGYSTHLDPGITWVTTITMPGDWSASGKSSGDHFLLAYDPLWTITKDFTYDPVTNQTTFSLLNTNYPGADSPDDGPYPDFALIGTAVPEPATLALVLCGALFFRARQYFERSTESRLRASRRSVSE